MVHTVQAHAENLDFSLFSFFSFQNYEVEELFFRAHFKQLEAASGPVQIKKGTGVCDLFVFLKRSTQTH